VVRPPFANPISGNRLWEMRANLRGVTRIRARGDFCSPTPAWPRHTPPAAAAARSPPEGLALTRRKPRDSFFLPGRCYGQRAHQKLASAGVWAELVTRCGVANRHSFGKLGMVSIQTLGGAQLARWLWLVRYGFEPKRAARWNRVQRYATV
jgi:hypothetical protein